MDRCMINYEGGCSTIRSAIAAYVIKLAPHVPTCLRCLPKLDHEKDVVRHMNICMIHYDGGCFRIGSVYVIKLARPVLTC